MFFWLWFFFSFLIIILFCFYVFFLYVFILFVMIDDKMSFWIVNILYLSLIIEIVIKDLWNFDIVKRIIILNDFII